MIVLGLSDFWRHPAAALVRDGEIVAFAEEERFVRVKAALGRFPTRAIGYCLDQAGIHLGDVDRIAYGWDADKYPWRMLAHYVRMGLSHGGGAGGDDATTFASALSTLDYYRPAAVRERVRHGLRAGGHGDPPPPIEHVPHHLAHATSAYFLSGFEDAAVLVMDGSGEERCTTVFEGRGDRLTERTHVDIPDSLGWFYAAITAFLGLRPYEDEAQVMALASFGDARSEIGERVRRMLRFEDGLPRVDALYTVLGGHTHHEQFSDRLVELLGPPRLPGQPLTDRHRDVAAAAQALLEEAGSRLARHALSACGSPRLCLAGGVSLNCKMNGALARLPEVDDLFVQPAAHDAGAALGAALWLSAQLGDSPRRRLTDVYLGPGFEPGAVRDVLRTCGARFDEPADLPAAVAERLAGGEVVAWFQGRMEAGPRALGHRSILADPSSTAVRDRLNATVKRRQPWRPFCPSMTAAACDRYLRGAGDPRFMIVAYDVAEEHRERLAGAIHVDGSTRPQAVTADAEPLYHALLTEVGARTGTEVVINTSLNVRGEPIACTPEDALRCFHGTDMDALAVGPFLVDKR